MLATEGDVWPHLADRADTEVDGDKGLRFSYRWDLGRSRLVMIDSRNARILHSGNQKILGDSEFRWLETQVNDGLDEVDHLILGSSLPWLIPPVIGDLQMVNERAADRKGLRGRLAEKVCQTVDLEHWSAFNESFLRLSRHIIDVASRGTDGPATISVLSGDVHHSYMPLAPSSPTQLRGCINWSVAGAQLRAGFREAPVQARLVQPARPDQSAVGGGRRGSPRATAGVGERRRSALRKYHRHPAHGRPHRRGLLRSRVALPS